MFFKRFLKTNRIIPRGACPPLDPPLVHTLFPSFYGPLFFRTTAFLYFRFAQNVQISYHQYKIDISPSIEISKYPKTRFPVFRQIVDALQLKKHTAYWYGLQRDRQRKWKYMNKQVPTADEIHWMPGSSMSGVGFDCGYMLVWGGTSYHLLTNNHWRCTASVGNLYTLCEYECK